VHIGTTEQAHMPDMKKLAVVMNKGGVGKTRTSCNIAVAAATAGLNVLLLDMDTQENAAQWGSRRTKRLGEKSLPVVKFVTENGLPDELARAEAAGCELVVIDTPPSRGTEAPAAVEEADLVLAPFEADIESYNQLPRTQRLARSEDKPVVALLNKATPNSRSEEEAARAVLEARKLPSMAPVVLHRFKVHRDASTKGLTAQELEPDSTAAAEIRALWDWLSAQLQIGKSANVHKRTGRAA
jgi:chromosome partitioning protein